MIDRRTQMTTAGLNLIAQAMSIIDEDLKLVQCNRMFERMFDLPQELAQPGTAFEAIIRHLAEKGDYGEIQDLDTFIKDRVDQALTFEPHYIERTRSNGRTIAVEGSPLPMGGWVAVYTDITEIKSQEALLRARSDRLSEELFSRAEELAATNRKLAATITALEETKRQLTVSEAQTRLTTETIPAHVAHVDQAGTYTYSNRRLSAILPERPSEIVGLHLEQALGQSAYDKIKPHLARAYAGEQAVFEFNDDASARRIRVSFTPDDAGGVYILSMDITEETQTRVALQQTRRRSLAAQMTSGMAHDFSNLLTIIMGFQGKLSRMNDLPEAAQSLVSGTLAAAERGGVLLDRIGEMTAARSYRPVSVKLPELLRDALTLARSTLPKGIRLDLALEGLQTPILMDPGMLQDAIINLILNARYACGAEGEIRVKAQEVGQTWIEISVSDSGPGFSEQALSRALEPFFTTKGREGSGLGLPMVYDMTKLAGGDLVLSNGDNGAIVTLRLPLRPAQNMQGGLILLVEDEPDLRAEVRHKLTEMGNTVIEASSGEEAKALAANVPDISLVLSDIHLDGPLTGVDLAEDLAARQMPLILMTSLPSSDPLYRAACAIAPILRKPVSMGALRDVLNSEGAR